MESATAFIVAKSCKGSKVGYVPVYISSASCQPFIFDGKLLTRCWFLNDLIKQADDLPLIFFDHALLSFRNLFCTRVQKCKLAMKKYVCMTYKFDFTKVILKEIIL